MSAAVVSSQTSGVHIKNVCAKLKNVKTPRIISNIQKIDKSRKSLSKLMKIFIKFKFHLLSTCNDTWIWIINVQSIKWSTSMKSKLSALINYSATLLFAEKSSRWKNGREKKKSFKIFISWESRTSRVCGFLLGSFLFRFSQVLFWITEGQRIKSWTSWVTIKQKRRW